MNFLYFKRRPIKLLSAGLFVVLILFLFLNILNIISLEDQQTVQTYRPNKLVEQASVDLNTYDIQIDFNPDEKELTCIQILEYKNLTGDVQDRLFFQLYPNAFKYEEKTPFPREDMIRAYPNGFNPGQMDIISIKEDNTALEYLIRGYSEEVLEVHIPREIVPGEGIILSIEFKVNLPNCLGRFGYGDRTFNITNWHPILCVYSEDGWNTSPYFPIGDPFYSEAANYRVKITAPKSYKFACTGSIASVEERQDKNIWTIEAFAVRDFAIVASDGFIVDKKKVGKTTVYSYYFTAKEGKHVLKYVADAIGIFNKKFGEYPYSQISVVEADFYIGGMEYPNLILIDHSLYQPDSRDFLELVTVHETAHQWWYGVVGNNQIEEAWLDEGLTEYSTLIYYRHRYGEKKKAEMSESVLGEGKYKALSVYTQGKEIDETIARPIYRFPDWIVYDLLVYGKGAMMFEALGQKVGERQFYNILNRYYEDNMFKNAKLGNLLDACAEVTGEDYTEFFNTWLYNE